MSANGSFAPLSGAVFLRSFVFGLAGFALRYLRHTRPPMANLWALRKDIQTDERRRISELTIILYRHSE